MNQIQKWMIENKMTGEALAKLAEISPVTLSRILNEHFKPSYETAERLALVTGISMENLLKEE